MTRDAWLELDPLVDGRSSLVLGIPHVRFDGKLFGGTGLATAVSAMEAHSGRGALWATVQFVGVAEEGERLDITVTDVASGGTTSQLEVRATSSDRLVFSALGATARPRPDGFAAAFATMPEVPPPDDAPPLRLGGFDPTPEMLAKGPFACADYRMVTDDRGEVFVWARPLRWSLTRATLAYLADFVPSAVLRSAGRFGGGTSLDNTIRFGSAVEDPDGGDGWVLLENVPFFADNGFVHGAARIWTSAGTLVAVASQSAVARLFD